MEQTLQRALLAAVIEQMPAAVVIAEAPTGRVIAANAQVAAILGRALDAPNVDGYGEWRGYRRDGRAYERHEWPLARAILLGESVEREDIAIVRADGSIRTIRVSAAPIHDDGRIVAAVTTFFDVTSETKEQDALDLVADASEIVAESLEYERTLRGIEQMAIPRFADIAFVYLIDDAGTITRHEVAATDPETEQKIREVWLRYPITEAPIARAIASGEPSWTQHVNDAAWEFIADEEQRRAVAALGIRSTIIVPMRVAGRTLGAMVFARTRQTAYETLDVLVAEEIARRAAAAMERSRLFTAEREQRTRLEHLQALTATLATAITTDEVCDAVIAESRDLVGANAAVVMLLEGDALRILRSDGIEPSVIERYASIPIDAALPVAEAARHGRPSWIKTRDEAPPRTSMLQDLPRSANEAWAVVPLSVPGHVVGVLGLAFSTPQSFPESTQTFILSIARQSAQALERALLFDRERAAREEAEHASRAKDEFLAILSHELRTPLTTVIGWADLLRMTYRDDDPSVRFAIEALRSSALTQARLIDDLLDVSRIVTGKLRIRRERTDLAAAVAKAAEAMRVTAEAKELTLAIDAPGPVMMDGDPARLQQIVSNLVGNAIKFTPNGGRIDVTVRRHEAEADIVVSDSGEGIAPDFLPHVFERFRQASVGDSRMHSGLGLGLSLVQNLAQIHGGRVRAESDGRGHGATFTVTLPVLPA